MVRVIFFAFNFAKLSGAVDKIQNVYRHASRFLPSFKALLFTSIRMKIKARSYFNVALIIYFSLMVFVGFQVSDTDEVESSVVADQKPLPENFKVQDPEFILEKIEQVRTVKQDQVKNIIFMVGDGMGLSQITAGYYANHQKLSLQRLKRIGLMTTHSKTSILTDSAAGATAFATGKKTRNGMVSMSPDTVAMPTILEYAEAQKLSTGVVVTSTVTHATPASFYGHQPNRNSVNERLIAQLYDADLEVAIGGGKKYLSNRVDGRDMEAEFLAKGYSMIDSIDEAEGHDYNKLLALVTPAQPKGIIEGRDSTFLPRATEKGIQVLNHNPNGFFLLVEGSQIDWGGHSNDSEYLIKEMIEFNATIEKVLDFAEADGNTLVVITADHETGGYSINDGIMSQGVIRPGWTTDYHTATMVPVFAYGPGSEAFTGIYDNTDIFKKMMDAYGFEYPKDEVEVAK